MVFWFRLEGGERLQEERALPEGVQVVEWNSSAPLRSWLDYARIKKQFADVIRRVQPDVIHAGPVQRVALLAALCDFHPLVTMSWGFDMLADAHQNIIWKSITRFVLRKSDWLIADCQTVKKMAGRFGFDAQRVSVFPWGVDLYKFSADKGSSARRRVGFEKSLLVVHTRSWEPRYGVDIALDGLRIALKTNPHIHLLMLGGGSQEAQIKQFVEENDLSEHVHFLGYQSNEKLAEYYRAGDVYLSASHVDGSSVALLEAMACACVPIVSDIPSNLEWVENGTCGWTFQDGSAAELAGVLIQAAKTNLHNFSLRARQKVEREADWEKGKQKLLDAYHSAITVVKNGK